MLQKFFEVQVQTQVPSSVRCIKDVCVNISSDSYGQSTDRYGGPPGGPPGAGQGGPRSYGGGGGGGQGMYLYMFSNKIPSNQQYIILC